MKVRIASIMMLAGLMIIAASFMTACSSPAYHGPVGEESEEDSENEEMFHGMIEVDVGDGETRWIRAYEDIPVSTLRTDQFETGERFIRYTGDEYATMQGIDVSTFQGEIDWNAVAGDGIEFAMLRIGGRGYGSGEIYEDDSFLTNLRGATENGVRVGAYFFSQAVDPAEAAEEADYVVRILQDLPADSVTMPVAFDWEMVGGDETRTGNIDPETLTSCAVAFCERIAEAGYTPMVYAYRYLAYEMYDLPSLSAWPLWISTLDHSPDFYYAFSMWQYTEQGSVNGIGTAVDLNLFFEPK